MSGSWAFVRDHRGAVMLDWMGVTGGILALGLVLVYAIFSGGTGSSTGEANRIAAPESVRPESGGALRLTERVGLPVGSVAVHSDGSFTSFETPDGGWVDAWSTDGSTVPEGARLTSPDTFTLENGDTLAAASFASSYTEAYSSSVDYAFR